MRDTGSLLAELDDGDVEKLVLTRRNQLRAVVVSVERWSEAEQALAQVGEPVPASRPNATGPAGAIRDRRPAL